jgi:hypothetical protein
MQRFRSTTSSRSIENVQAYSNTRPCYIHHPRNPAGTGENFEELEHRKSFGRHKSATGRIPVPRLMQYFTRVDVRLTVPAGDVRRIRVEHEPNA